MEFRLEFCLGFDVSESESIVGIAKLKSAVPKATACGFLSFGFNKGLVSGNAGASGPSSLVLTGVCCCGAGCWGSDLACKFGDSEYESESMGVVPILRGLEAGGSATTLAFPGGLGFMITSGFDSE